MHIRVMRPRRCLWTMLPVTVVSALVGSLSAATPAPAPVQEQRPPAVTLRVDASHRRPVRSQVGFLHGLRADAPPDRLIRPLRPALWRGTPATVDVARAARLGADFVLVLSDLWGYPGAGWYGRRAPWEDLEAWRAFVRSTAERWKGRPIVWDIWNEPDAAYFWTGTPDQYAQIFTAAAVEIRSVAGPRARLAGPSTSLFRRDWIETLLAACQAAGCEVNVLTWHEFIDEAHPVEVVTRHLRRARESYLEGPAADALGLRGIQINETIAPADNLSAGEQVAYLRALEDGAADASARGCWTDPCGFGTCDAATLDGLLDHRTGRPRAVWWAVKWYADGVDHRVASSSSDAAVAVLASADAKGRVELLVGYENPHERPVPASVSIRLRLEHLGRLGIPAGPVRIRIATVASAGEDPVTPRRSPDTIAQFRGHRLRLELGTLPLHDVMRVRVTPAPAGAD